MIAAAVVSLGPWAWVILGIVLIGVEVMASGVFFIWLGLAAIATGLLAAAIGLSWQIAALTFAVLALLAVILGRWLMRASAPHDTQAATLNRRGEGLVGREFVLETPIEGGSGRIRVDDSSWRVTGRDRSAGQRVRVVRVEGTTLVVDDV